MRGGILHPDSGHSALETFLAVVAGAGECYGVEARDIANHPTLYRTALHRKPYLATVSIVGGAETLLHTCCWEGRGSGELSVSRSQCLSPRVEG